MDKKKQIIIIVVISLVIVIIGAVLLFNRKDTAQENLLKTEINSLNSKNIKQDKYDTKIKTNENYAKVEKAIKEYKNEYAKAYQEVLSILNDDKLATMLSATNYKEDGPEFKASKEYISTTRKTYNDNIDLSVSQQVTVVLM